MWVACLLPNLGTPLTLSFGKEKKRKEKRKKRKGYKIYGHWNKEVKISLFPDHVILYLENSNVSLDTLLECIRQFKMLAAYSII